MGTTKAFSERVAAEVRAGMARKRVNALQVSAATGIPNSTLSRRLNGLAPFTVDELSDIAEFLGVEAADFLPRTALAQTA